MPSHIKAAEREMARRAVETYGLPREVDPFQALTEELHRTAGHVAWLQGKVRDLGEEDLSAPVGTEGTVPGGAYSHPEEKRNFLIALYQEERAHLAKIAKTCIDVGMEERMVRIAEQQGQVFAAAIQGILGDLSLSPAQQAKVPAVVRQHLMLVAGEESLQPP